MVNKVNILVAILSGVKPLDISIVKKVLDSVDINKSLFSIVKTRRLY